MAKTIACNIIDIILVSFLHGLRSNSVEFGKGTENILPQAKPVAELSALCPKGLFIIGQRWEEILGMASPSLAGKPLAKAAESNSVISLRLLFCCFNMTIFRAIYGHLK